MRVCLLKNEGAPITIPVECATSRARTQGVARAVDVGASVGKLNMVMTERNQRWCLSGATGDRLMDIAAKLQF